MSREFAVTVATPSIRIEPKGTGELAFTVSNLTGLPVRARAILRAEEGTQAEWLSIRGDPFRDMQPNGTHVFIVDVHVPPGAPKGSYPFTLVVVDMENPDERYVVGPRVAIEVLAVPPVFKRRRRWPVVVTAIVLIDVVLAAFLVLRQRSGTGGSGPTPTPAAQLGEACAGRSCGTGLSCGPEGLCVGAVGFTGCTRGHQCVTGLCAQGTCQDCPAPRIICGDRCADPVKDQDNCGACGRKCILGAVCTQGICLQPGTTPAPGGGRPPPARRP